MTPVRFREVIAPPIWLIAFIYFLFSSISLSLWASIGSAPALWCQIFLTFVLVYIALKSRMIIEVKNNELSVNKAHIELRFLGDVTILDTDAMRFARGRDADPAAYLAIKFWSPRGVLVKINDSRDLTPYWLISSKRAKELAAALG